jgi:TetR/AcrR family transcriptional regulator, cholesterol catabolism regulator
MAYHEVDGVPEASTEKVKKPTPAAIERLSEIKAAAAKCFYDRGYHGTDLRFIAVEAGMHPSSFYNYIKSKQELLYLIMMDGLDEMNRGLDAAIREAPDPVAALRLAIQFQVSVTANSRFNAWTQQVEVRSLTGEFRETVIFERDKYQRKWVSIVRAGIKSGQFRKVDAKLAVIGMLSMAQVSRWYSPGGDAKPEAIAELFADIVISGLAAPAAR